MPEKEMIKRLQDKTPECGAPGDENDWSYGDSLTLDAIELALHGPPKWKEQAVRTHAELIFGRKNLR